MKYPDADGVYRKEHSRQRSPEPRCQIIPIRFSTAEHDILFHAAGLKSLRVSTFMAQEAVKAAIKVIKGDNAKKGTTHFEDVMPNILRMNNSGK